MQLQMPSLKVHRVFGSVSTLPQASAFLFSDAFSSKNSLQQSHTLFLRLTHELSQWL